MPSSDSNDSTGLRPDAGPIQFQQLTRDQQHAGARAARLLEKMSKPELQEPENNGRHTYLPEIDSQRNSHIVLIDGRRGSGKSQLMLTLLKSYRDAATGIKPAVDFKGNIRPELHIVPVGLVDLQPLPDDTNLLFHILGHLERVVSAMERERGGPRQRVSAPWTEVNTQELLSRQRWREFARAAPFRGGSHLRERKAQLDPESYAVELEHGELQRLDAMHRFRQFMEALVSDYQEWMHWEHDRPPFFLLTIDDADMNPDHSSELLELVRKLWHRRLGFLLTGHSNLFVTKLRIQFEEKIGKGDESLAQRLAYDVYDKIVPRIQRCPLHLISPDEVLGLPQGPHSESIKETLRRFPLGGRPGSSTSPGVEDLGAMLEENAPMRASLPNRLRSLLSLQEELKDLRAQGDRAEQAVAHLWKRAMDNAPYTGVEGEPFRPLVRFDERRDRLTVSATILTSSQPQNSWTPAPLREDWDYSRMTPGEFQLHAQLGKDPIKFPPRMVGAFMLAHDVMRTREQRETEGLVFPKEATTSFMRIRWTRGKGPRALAFDWRTPEWNCFTDFHRFIQGWNHVLEATPRNAPLELDRLGWAFLRLVVQIATGNLLDLKPLTQKPDWSLWGSLVVSLSDQQGSSRDMAMRDWALRHSAQLATPESGTSTAFATNVIDALGTAYGRHWPRVQREQQLGRFYRVDRAIAESPLPAGMGSGATESTSAALAKIDNQFPGHPFTRRITRHAEWRSPTHGEAVRPLVDNVLRQIQVPQRPASLEQKHNSFLNSYINRERRRLLARNPEHVLKNLGNSLSEFASMDGGASHAVVTFWRELATARGKPRLKSKVALSKHRLVLQDAPLRQLFHDRLRAQWARNDTAAWELRTERGLSLQVSQSPPVKALMKSVPLGMEAVLRMAFDYSTDQEDYEGPSPVANEWWPTVRTRLPDGSHFAPWPAITWPTLWEWEELQEGWKEAFRKAQLLERVGDVDTLILDTLAHWLLWAFRGCASRHELSRSHFSASPTRGEWTQAVSECFRDAGRDDPNDPAARGPKMGRRILALRFSAERLSLFATPESGLSSEACMGILDAGGLSTDKLNGWRLDRLLDAGIPEAKARLALENLDREHPEHPWVKTVGPFQLPSSTPQD